MTASSTKAPTGKGASNGNGTGDPLATALAYEQAITDRADAERDGENYEGVLTPRLLGLLRPLLVQPIPGYYIGHTPRHSQSYKGRDGKETKWPPHDITGISGAQVQATRMSNVLGRQHWRKLARYAKDGQLVQVWIIVGNDLAKARIDETGQLEPNGADILISEDGWGAYNKGPDPANHYKGAETSAIKRVFARVGPGEEVYRQEVDLELKPEDQLAPSTDPAVPEVVTIDGDRVAALTDLAQAWVTEPDDKDEQSKRTKQITRLLRSEGLTGEIKSVTQGFAGLTPGMADNVEAWLREQKGGAA